MPKAKTVSKSADTDSTARPPGPLVIRIGLQGDGAVYVLGPHFRQWIRKAYPHGSWAPDVFIAYRNKDDFVRSQRRYWLSVASMLTGLSAEELAPFGVVRIEDAVAGKHWDIAIGADQSAAGKAN